MPFYYPIAVGGPIPRIIEGFVAEFEKENPGIKLRPIFTGSYQQSLTKALTGSFVIEMLAQVTLMDADAVAEPSFVVVTEAVLLIVEQAPASGSSSSRTAPGTRTRWSRRGASSASWTGGCGVSPAAICPRCRQTASRSIRTR